MPFWIASMPRPYSRRAMALEPNLITGSARRSVRPRKPLTLTDGLSALSGEEKAGHEFQRTHATSRRRIESRESEGPWGAAGLIGVRDSADAASRKNWSRLPERRITGRLVASIGWACSTGQAWTR